MCLCDDRSCHLPGPRAWPWSVIFIRQRLTGRPSSQSHADGPGPWWSNTCLHQHISTNFIISSHVEPDTNWTSVVDHNHRGLRPSGTKLLFLYEFITVLFLLSHTAENQELWHFKVLVHNLGSWSPSGLWCLDFKRCKKTLQKQYTVDLSFHSHLWRTLLFF